MPRPRTPTRALVLVLLLGGLLAGGLRPTTAQESATDHPAHRGAGARLDAHGPARLRLDQPHPVRHPGRILEQR